MNSPLSAGRQLGMARLWAIAGFLALATPVARAHVVVAATETASETLVDQPLSVDGGAYSYYTLSLRAGAQLNVGLRVAGGLDNAIQTWLVDLNNFQLFKAGQAFNTWQGASPQITQQGSYAFTAPATGVYYLVLDNRVNLSGRNMTLRVERRTTVPNARTSALREAFEQRYEALQRAFIFPDFDIHVKSCGLSNAFSDPNITMCTELLDEVQREGVPAAELFVFYHEVGHSLLNLWRYPGHDNEDIVDEFATAILMMTDQQDVALQAAQWWASKDSQAEVGTQLLVDDRHSISVQRARNILNWLNREDEMLLRWMSFLVPNLTDAVLEDVATGTAETADQAWLVKAAKVELQERRLMAAN